MENKIDRIINEACRLWGMEKEDVLGVDRLSPLPLVRAVISHGLRNTLGMSYPKIGKVLNRNHASIIHYMKTYQNEYAYNGAFRKIADEMSIFLLTIRTGLQEELDNELNEIIG